MFSIYFTILARLYLFFFQSLSFWGVYCIDCIAYNRISFTGKASDPTAINRPASPWIVSGTSRPLAFGMVFRARHRRFVTSLIALAAFRHQDHSMGMGWDNRDHLRPISWSFLRQFVCCFGQFDPRIQEVYWNPIRIAILGAVSTPTSRLVLGIFPEFFIKPSAHRARKRAQGYRIIQVGASSMGRTPQKSHSNSQTLSLVNEEPFPKLICPCGWTSGC